MMHNAFVGLYVWLYATTKKAAINEATAKRRAIMQTRLTPTIGSDLEREVPIVTGRAGVGLATQAGTAGGTTRGATEGVGEHWGSNNLERGKPW